MIITTEDLNALDQEYRRSFVNSLAGFRQVAMVGTKSVEGVSNLAIFNSLIHLGARPALFGLISRPESVPRDTLTNILETGEYTINFVKAADVEKAHQTSARYAKGVSEFTAVGFDEEYVDAIIAPFIAGANVKIGMKFETKIDIELNGTVMIIGSVQYIEIDDLLVSEDGFVDLAAAETLLSCGLDAYFTAQPIKRLSYAKPNSWPTKIV